MINPQNLLIKSQNITVKSREKIVSKEKKKYVKNNQDTNYRGSFFFLITALGLIYSGCAKKNKTNQKELVESENISRTSEAFNDNNESWSSIDNPKKDGWTTEKLAEDAQSKLNEIKELILGDLADKKFKILSPGFSFICYDDRSLEKYLESENYQTWKQTEKTETISLRRDGFWDYFLNNYTTSSEEKRVKFKIISVSGNSSIFTTRVLSSISIKTEKNIIDDRSEWNVEWIIKPDNQLLITKIEIQKFERTKKAGLEKGFSDCTEFLLSSNQSYQNQLLKGVNYWLDRLPAYAMLNRFGTPGITIADVNNDGLEDLYLCQEPGIPNKLFIQMQDGKLKDSSEEFGVNWLEDSRSSLIVDLNNNGHRDLVVAMYGYVAIAENLGMNKGFKLIEIIPTNESNTSLAAADFDLDGKLDVYVCCYAPNKVSDSNANLVMGGSSRRFIYHDDNNGPQNFMLRNTTQKGGEISFEDVTEVVGLNQNNNKWSFAASWEDFDNDGDSDLYVANDYGRNNLYRNDLGKFTDIAAEIGVEDSASGMSVTWGDYDLNGLMDIYVSNMFSSAGNRITTQKQFKPTTKLETRSRFKRFARGNTLFSNKRNEFIDRSVISEVTMGRWAWGSKFVDTNNDGWEDIVIANGYLSSDEDDTGDL